jgi:catalase
MAMVNPKSRVNYEPNSWPGAEAGPRENPEMGFQSYPAEEEGPKLRIRSESFADHYSQARQFYISQTPLEQTHIADSFVFELSKVERSEIRSRIVSHLLNVDDGLTNKVSKGLGLKEMPAKAEAAKPTRTDLKPSKSLSIMLNAHDTFEGRKVGMLVTDGVDSEVVAAMKRALDKEGSTFEFIAPTISGVKASDGVMIPANQKIGGGPSVLYDAVALLVSKDGANILVNDPAARDFVADAFAQSKYIGYSEATKPFLMNVLGADKLDEGFIAIRNAMDASKFIQKCRKLRFWDRQAG